MLHIFSDPPPPADARIRYGPDALHFGDLRLPGGPGPHPVVVVVHGGFWRAAYDLEHIGHACAALAEAAGVATWSVEYRRIGNPGGGWPGTFHDVAAAADHLHEIAPDFNLDLDRVVTLGHSAGGHLALWLAGRRRIPDQDTLYSNSSAMAAKIQNPKSKIDVRAAIPLAGVVDLCLAWEMRLSRGVVRDCLGGTPDQVPERYASASPMELLPLGVRQVLIHGTEDEDVPYEISKAYCAAALSKGDDASLVTLKGTGHFELIDPLSREWPVVVDVVRDVIRNA